MKKFKLILLTCISVFLFTVACDKEILETKSIPNPIQTRANLAAKSRKDIDRNFLNYDFSKYKIAPLWDLAIVYKNGKSIEIPYTVNDRLIMPSVSKTVKGRQRLLLTLNGSKVSAMTIQYIPDLDFKGNIKEINAENFKSRKFSGTITFQSLGDDRLHIWLLKDGKVEKKKKGTILSKKKNYRPSGYEYVCIQLEVIFDIYGEIRGEWVLIGSYSEIQEHCEMVYVPDSGGDEGGDDDDDDPTDCATNPSLPWCDNGGGGGEEDNAPKPVWPNESQLKSKLCVNSSSAFHLIKTQMINDWRNELNNAGIYDSNPDIGYDNKTNNLMFKSVSNSSKTFTAPINFSAYDDCP